MHTDRLDRLTVEARLLPDPCLWCWEIRDPTQGAVIESSWAADWAAYESAEEALRAGWQRLRGRVAA